MRLGATFSPRLTCGLASVSTGRSKFTIGADATAAAGPVGRNAAAATDARLKAEILSYSRSRGLFVGVSVEGAGILMDYDANESFYQLHGGSPGAILANQVPAVPVAAVQLRDQLGRLSMSTAPPVMPAPRFIPAGPRMTATPAVMYSQPCCPTPSTTARAPLLRTAKRSPTRPAM